MDLITNSYVVELALTVGKIMLVVGPLLIAVAYLTLAERRVIGFMQLRKGPNVVGPFGMFQPFADALKLMVKETILPAGANKAVFILAPMLTFILALVAWAVIPFGEGLVIADINVGILYLFAISSLGVYGVIMAGWASNSKYAFLGALRSAAQMVSYEVSMGLVIINVLICVGSLNLSAIVEAQRDVWFALPLLPMFFVFFISTLAETNRAPFDLPEGESELVAGYFVEYSSMSFALFFLGEYANMILMSGMTTVLFLGGWLPPFDIWPLNIVPGPVWFILKVMLLLFVFLWVRATTPRYRYDQLMRLGWKIFLPFSLLWVVLTSGFLLYTGNLIDAAEAKRLDLVNEVVPIEELDAAVERQALTIAKLPAATVEYNKKLINASYEHMGLRQVIERSMELEAIALASQDSSPEIEEFNAIREKDGLKAALSWNAERFVDEDAWFKKSRERG